MYNSVDSKTWTDYNPDFIPTFFNSDLSVMFPDTTERETAIRTCYDSTADSDPAPTERKECYFDFKVSAKPVTVL